MGDPRRCAACELRFDASDEVAEVHQECLDAAPDDG